MAITNTDVLAPVGPVEKSMFPGEDVEGTNPPATVLEDRIDEYITQAGAKNGSLGFADQDAADLAWTLHLTFMAAWRLAVARPSTDDSKVQVLGSESFQKDQRQSLRDMADDYLEEYNVLLNAIPSTAAPVGVPSHSTTNTFDY